MGQQQDRRQPPERGAHTRAEMAEQPRVLRALVDRGEEVAATVTRVVPQPLRGVVLVARGSSDNAAIYGRYAIELSAGVPVALAAPSLQTRYGVRPRADGYLAVAVSQSGRTPEIVTATEALAAGGAATVAITNEPDSPLAAATDAAVVLDTGPERAVPATKTFTAQVAVLALIAERLGDAPWDVGGWETTLEAVDTVVADLEAVEELVAPLAAADRVLPVGRGLLFAAALEAGLKIAETTGAAVHAYSAADLLHGPIATVGPGTLALCFAAAGPTLHDVREVAAALTLRDARLALVADDPAALGSDADWLPVPTGVPEGLATLPQVVRGQQLAYATAMALGIDPDRPFDLSKVTPTT